MRYTFLYLLLVLPNVSQGQFPSRLDPEKQRLFACANCYEFWFVLAREGEKLYLLGRVEFPNDNEAECYFSDGGFLGREPVIKDAQGRKMPNETFARAYNRYMAQNQREPERRVDLPNNIEENTISIIVIDEKGNRVAASRGDVTWFEGPNKLSTTGYSCAFEKFVTDAFGKATVSKKDCPYLEISVSDSKGVYASTTGDMKASQKEYRVIQKFK